MSARRVTGDKFPRCQPPSVSHRVSHLHLPRASGPRHCPRDGRGLTVHSLSFFFCLSLVFLPFGHFPFSLPFPPAHCPPLSISVRIKWLQLRATVLSPAPTAHCVLSLYSEGLFQLQSSLGARGAHGSAIFGVSSLFNFPVYENTYFHCHNSFRHSFSQSMFNAHCEPDAADVVGSETGKASLSRKRVFRRTEGGPPEAGVGRRATMVALQGRRQRENKSPSRNDRGRKAREENKDRTQCQEVGTAAPPSSHHSCTHCPSLPALPWRPWRDER